MPTVFGGMALGPDLGRGKQTSAEAAGLVFHRRDHPMVWPCHPRAALPPILADPATGPAP